VTAVEIFEAGFAPRIRWVTTTEGTVFSRLPGSAYAEPFLMLGCMITCLVNYQGYGLLTNYLTITQAAELRGVSRQAIYESISRGTLPATKLGNQWLITRKDLRAFRPHPGGPGTVWPKKRRRSRARARGRLDLSFQLP
jgi:excisionase family DNA binding protein